MNKGKYSIVLKNRSFLLFFIGRIISSFGDNIDFIALTLYVFTLTGKALDVSMFMLCMAIPKFLIIPFSGVLADTLDNKRMLIIADVGRGILVAILPFCTNIYQIFVIAVLVSCFSSFSYPARQAFYPKLVSKEELLQANSLNSIFMSIISLVGFAAGGAIVGFFSVKYAFIIDSFTFMISATLLLFIKKKYSISKKSEITPLTIIQDMKSGILYCYKDDLLKFVMIFIFAISLISSMVDPMIVSYTKQSLNASDIDFSIIYVMVGVGSIVGTYLNGKYLQKINKLKALVITTICDGICLTVIGFLKLFIISVVMFTIWGVVTTLFSIYLFTLIQEFTNRENMGKVFGVVGLIRDPVTIISYLIGGLFADWSSPSLVITVVGSVEFIFCVFLIYTKLYKKANVSISLKSSSIITQDDKLS